MLPPSAVAGAGPAPGSPGAGALLLHAAGARWRVTVDGGAEVAPCPPVTPIPGAPGWLAGMFVHKGAAMALVDPAALAADAARDERARPRRRVLVVRLPGLALGVAADDVDADPGTPGVPALELDALVERLLGESLEAAP